MFDIKKDSYDLPIYEDLMFLYEKIKQLIDKKTIISAFALGAKGIFDKAIKIGVVLKTIGI